MPALHKEFIHYYAQTSEFWQNMPIIKDSQQFVQSLRNKNHKIIWVTAPYIYCQKWAYLRTNWLNKNFKANEYGDEIIITKDKARVQADLMIEDNIDNLLAWESKKHSVWSGILIDAPYNNKNLHFPYATSLKHAYYLITGEELNV